MAGAAMGPGTGRAASRLRLPAGQIRRSADCRPAWSRRPGAAVGRAPGAGVRLARAVWLCRFCRRPEPLVATASKGPGVRLTGRTAIVTGAAPGSGRASALLFGNDGPFVALVDRDEAGLQQSLAAIK